MVKFCPKCGNQIKEDSKFCANCGYKTYESESKNDFEQQASQYSGTVNSYQN